jgi:hypothetical protein
MYNLKIKNFHVVSPSTSTLTTKANHLRDMVRWGGSGLILPKNKTRQKNLKKNKTIIVNHYSGDVVGYA